MNHIRYATTNSAVCEKPRLLGHDIVMIGPEEGPSCSTCLSLLLVHNAKERQYDLLVELPKQFEARNNYNVTYLPPESRLSISWWSFLAGISISSGLWIGGLISWPLVFG